MRILDEAARHVAEAGQAAPPVIILTLSHLIPLWEEAVLRKSGRGGTHRLIVTDWRGLLERAIAGSGAVLPPAWTRARLAAELLVEWIADPELLPDWPRRLSAAEAVAAQILESWPDPPDGLPRRQAERCLQALRRRPWCHPHELYRLAAAVLAGVRPFAKAWLFVLLNPPPTDEEARLLEVLAEGATLLSADPVAELGGPGPAEVRLSVAPTPEWEVRAVLAEVADWLADGAACDDLLLLVAPWERYRPILEREAAAAGIPLSCTVAPPLAEERVLRFLDAFADWLADPEEPIPWLRLVESGVVRPDRRRWLLAAGSAGLLRRRLLGVPEVFAPLFRREAISLGTLAQSLAGLLDRRSLRREEWDLLSGWWREFAALVRRASPTGALAPRPLVELLRAALALLQGHRSPSPPGVTVAPLRQVVGQRRQRVWLIGADERSVEAALVEDPGRPLVRPTAEGIGRALIAAAGSQLSLSLAEVDGERTTEPARWLLDLSRRLRLPLRPTPRVFLNALEWRSEALLEGLPEEHWPTALRVGRVFGAPPDDPPALPESAVRGLLGYPGECSVQLLERFASCGFQALAALLGLYSLKEGDEVDPLGRGRIWHACLEAVSREPRLLDPSVGEAELARHLAELWRKVVAQQDVPVLRGPRGEAIIAAWLMYARPILAYLAAERKESAFRPRFAECAFGRGGTWPALRLETARGPILLSGRIDRVDEAEGRLRIVDYKTGARTLEPRRLAAGVDLQLLAYWFLLQDVLGPQGKTVEAAEYWSIVLPGGRLDDPDEQRRPLFWQERPRGLYLFSDSLLSRLGSARFHRLRLRPDGEIEGDGVPSTEADRLLGGVQRLLTRLAEGLLMGAFRPNPWRDARGDSPCLRCDLQAICRHDGRSFRPLPAVEDWPEVIGYWWGECS